MRHQLENFKGIAALAAAERAILVSGDGHITVLVGQIPVRTLAEFLVELEAGPAPEPG
jgi:hypothetical protein